jgi:predicted nucleic acid-binding protein
MSDQDLISVDSLEWIERFGGGPKQAQYNRVIDDTPPARILTSVVTVYEVYGKAKAMRGEHAALENVAALGQTQLVPVDQEIALAAADYSLDIGLHFADALIYATARRFHAELYTSDPALRDLPGVHFV